VWGWENLRFPGCRSLRHHREYQIAASLKDHYYQGQDLLKQRSSRGSWESQCYYRKLCQFQFRYP